MPARRLAAALLLAPSLALVGPALGAGAGDLGSGRAAPAARSRDVGPAELARLLGTGNVVLVNVHVPYDGEIERTDVFVPFNAIEAHLGRLPERRDTRLVVYCRSGAMGAIAAKTLVRLGYTNVRNLDGGMVGWERAGYPLARGPR
ncbi:MAG: rhodanese-like domain-containing protein [Candidatus Rokubacteria bacterium]|nr:rhodanese-like domain-containing protein [Candidatus Rokubacteria bacterium]